MKINEKNISLIKKLCEKYRVRTTPVFDFDENDPFEYTDLYFQLKENLEKLLKRQIDLIEERGIKNQFFRKELNETKVLIYGQ